MNKEYFFEKLISYNKNAIPVLIVDKNLSKQKRTTACTLKFITEAIILMSGDTNK